jgi:hypothetical protein
MGRHTPVKGIALYSERESQLWNDVEQAVSDEYDTEYAREGEIAAQVFAEYVGAEGPLECEKA